MECSPLFFKIRAFAFVFIMLFSFLWLVLLSVEMFARWTMSDEISQSLMITFILSNTITLITLPILILVKFRIWLDAARLFFLFVVQAASAIAGTYWNPKIQCPDQSLDDIGVCQLISAYTMIASWIIPGLLLLYSTYFAAVVYLQSRNPIVVESKRVDHEIGPSDCFSAWRDMLREIVGVQGSSSTPIISPRPFALPPRAQISQTGQPNIPRRQSTMPSSPHNSSQQTLVAPNRHHSLPAFKHGNASQTLLTLHTLATTPPSPHPQTPSSYSYSSPSSARFHSQPFPFGPGVPDVQSPMDHRWRSKHLSIMPPSSSPRETESAEASPTTRSMRTKKLSKPIPAHLL